MKVEVRDLILLDAIRVVLAANEDQQEHFIAMTGQAWDIDSVAMGGFQTAGPKWSIHIDGSPVAVGGFAYQREGVYRDWFIFTPAAFEPRNYMAVTRLCRRLMDRVLRSIAHRLECIVPAARVEASSKLAKWYKILGYNKEALLYGYCANGADAVCYSRVKH
jgi:hypothetical protein